jgi:hypothetical protein
MWVRVATFEGGDTDRLDKLMDERMSSGEMTPPQGMSSVLILDDKDAKKRKFLAFFDSRDALEAAEAGFDQQGDTIPEEIRGKRTSVHYYDVVIYDGDVEAAKAARVSLLEGSPESIDAGLDRTRGDTLPKVRAIDGNVGAIGLADRDNGRVDDHALGQRGVDARERAGGRSIASAVRRHERPEDRERRAVRRRDGADGGGRASLRFI